MASLSKNKLASHIVGFIEENDNLALFAGAGVGVRAGLPNWQDYLLYLAGVADRYDTATGDYMKIQISRQRFQFAADIYKNCPDIPKGIKYGELISPFEKPPYPEKINALTSLPFSVFVTTNYDRSIHISLDTVTGKDLLSVELGDPLMKRALFLDSVFVARIHGRAEIPDSIVIAKEDYLRIKQDEHYQDFIIQIFTKFNCIFVGFSFLDPAINNVFEVIEEKISPNFPKNHIALLPGNYDTPLMDKLRELNISTHLYDYNENHGELWEAIKIASRSFSQEIKTDKPKLVYPLEPVQRYLATSYAQAKLGEELFPLRDTVVDGIIIDILKSAKKLTLSKESLSTSLRKILHISKENSLSLSQSRVEYLASKGICHIDGSKIILPRIPENLLEDDYEILIKGISNRLFVRHGYKITDSLTKVVRQCIEEILIARGWDLGASFVGSVNPQVMNLFNTVSSSIDRCGEDISERVSKAVKLSVYDLLQNPNEPESAVLARLGRISFALQLVLNSPTATITHSSILPERIYLDSNYVLRAILDGHPLHPVYIDALNTLANSLNSAGGKIEIIISRGLLKEVISHKDLALREVDELGLDDFNKLKDFILFDGTDNVNVFIGAFSGWNDRLTIKPIKFREFLHKVAPYNDEEQLASFLENIGIQTMEIKYIESEEQKLRKIHQYLKDAYSADSSWQGEKHKILIRNEAFQLFALEKDIDENIRSIFVSGDRRLRRLAVGDVLGKPGLSITSNRGFIQLIDMLLGLKTEPESLARLLWGTGVIEDETKLILHFTNLALKEYHDAMAKTLPEVLDSFIPKVVEQAKIDNINLIMTSPEERSRRAKFLDRFEKDFYEEMGLAIEKLDN